MRLKSVKIKQYSTYMWWFALFIWALLGWESTLIVNEVSATSTGNQFFTVQEQVYSQPDPDPAGGGLACFPIDVIFLIDHSTSMSGDGGASPNDPFGNRKAAVDQGINLLISNALNFCNGIIHRVAVVSFGTDAVVSLPLTNIGPFSPDEGSEAMALYDELTDQVPLTVLGQTDPADAFAEAAQILNNAGSSGSNEDDRRKRAIVYITDGIPCVNGEYGECGSTFPFDAYTNDMVEQLNEAFPFDPTLLNLENCLNELRAQRQDVNDELPAEGVRQCLSQNQVGNQAYDDSTYIWVTLLNDGNRPFPATLEEDLIGVTQSRAGSLVTLEQGEIATQFRTILEQLTGVRATRLACGNFAMNPYLRSANLNFFKLDPTTNVEIRYTDQNNVTHTLEGGVDTTGGFGDFTYIEIGTTETYQINDPHPGLWQLASDDNCESLDAFFEPVEIDPSSPTPQPLLPQYDRDPGYNTENPYYFQFSLYDSIDRDTPLAEEDDPIFAITVTATATSTQPIEATGQPIVQHFEFEYDEFGGNGPQFVSTTPVIVREVGTYVVKITATSHRHEGEVTGVGTNSLEVFDTPYVLLEQTFSYNVIPVTPFVLNILTPSAGEDISPVHGAAGVSSPPELLNVPVHVRLEGRNGESLAADIENMFADGSRPNTALQAVLETDDLQSGPVILTQVEGVPDEFTGELPGLNDVGEHQLRVSLVGDTVIDYAVDDPEVEVTFTRSDETWRFAAISPTEGETIRPVHDTPWTDGLHWPLRIQPLDLRIQLVDGDGRPYDDPETVMAYAPEQIRATVQMEEGRESTNLFPDPESLGQYLGTIETLGSQGAHQLTVDLDLSYDDFTPDSEILQISFVRQDSLLTTETTYYVLALLLLLFILFQIWRYFAIRNNKVSGELVFRDAGQAVATFNLHSGKNWREIKNKDLQLYPQLGLKKMRIFSLPQQKNSATGSEGEFGFDTPGFANNEGVRVRYTTEDGEKLDIELPPELPTPYNSSLFTMEYQPLQGVDNY